MPLSPSPRGRDNESYEARRRRRRAVDSPPGRPYPPYPPPHRSSASPDRRFRRRSPSPPRHYYHDRRRADENYRRYETDEMEKERRQAEMEDRPRRPRRRQRSYSTPPPAPPRHRKRNRRSHCFSPDEPDGRHNHPQNQRHHPNYHDEQQQLQQQPPPLPDEDEKNKRQYRRRRPHRRHSPRARRVSNDEDDSHDIEEDEGRVEDVSGKDAGATKRRPTAPRRRNNDKNQDHDGTSTTHDPASSNTHPDDTIGHFVGGRNTLIADRYQVLFEVGLGTFGRVLECIDLQRAPGGRSDKSRLRRRGASRSGDYDDENHRDRESRSGNDDSVCAIKIVRKVERYYNSAVVEAKIIRDVNRKGGRGLSHCVILHDSFTFQGHYCMVFESLGPSLFDFLKKHNYQPFPMVCVQDFTVQLLETMEFLHSFRLIHTDLKIENILLMNDREVTYDRYAQGPECTKIKLIDFGGACYDDDSKKSTIINTRQYRAPEVILETGWSMPSDMWSLGCILAELYQGELLFPTHNNVEHLALMEHVIGHSFPRRMLQNARARDLVDKAFDSSGRHRRERVLSAEHASFVRQSQTLEEIVHHDADRWFRRLLRQMLVMDPRERSTAHECLQYLDRNRLYHVRYA